MACAANFDPQNGKISVTGDSADEVHAVLLGVADFLAEFAREHPTILQPIVPVTDVHTGDRIQVTANVATVGRDANSTVDMRCVAGELAKVSATLRERAVSVEDYRELLAVHDAQRAAEDDDERGLLKALKEVGRRTLDIAQEVATSVTTGLISRAAGL